MLEYTLPLLSYNNNKYVILSRENETNQFSLLPYKLNSTKYSDIENKLDIVCTEIDTKKLYETTFQNNLIQIQCSHMKINSDMCNKNNLNIIVPLNDVINYTNDMITIYSTTLLNSTTNNLVIKKNTASQSSLNMFIDIFICSIFSNFILFMYIILLELSL